MAIVVQCAVARYNCAGKLCGARTRGASFIIAPIASARSVRLQAEMLWFGPRHVRIAVDADLLAAIVRQVDKTLVDARTGRRRTACSV